ncbi:MAG: NAD-dependent epimerase/dehydratase family protein [Burkholderiales bacterium]
MDFNKEMIADRQFSGQTVLVTGASGFIGSPLCRRLVAHGADVHAVSRIDRKADFPNLRWWKGALEDYALARDLVSRLKPRFIFHLAGNVRATRDLDMMLPCLHGNLTTVVNVLTAATEIGCERIVLAGSMEEPEDALAVTPSSPYAAAKWAASGYARMFHALYQTPIVNLRVFMVYGPGRQDLRKLIPYVTLALLREQIPKLSSGARPIDWVYVDDVVDGLLAAARAGDLVGGTIDLGSGVPTTVAETVAHLAELIPSRARPLLGEIGDRALEQACVADTAQAREKLNWSAKTPLKEGLRRTVEWYAQRVQAGDI